MLRFCIVLALAVPAFADTQDHFTKKRLAQEEQGVKEATVAAPVVVVLVLALGFAAACSGCAFLNIWDKNYI